MTEVTTALPGSDRRASWTLRVLLAIGAVLVVRFMFKYAVPYLELDSQELASFGSRRFGLLAHLAGGGIALLVGPVQLWLGETRTRMSWHRTVGKVYLGAVFIGCLGGYYLALTSHDVGWVYAWGLVGLATAWSMTTGMAYVAIRNRRIEQHREWMVRSYVVTMAFVFFRLFDELMQRFSTVDPLERQKAAAWLCWAIPLLVAEPLIQRKKVAGQGS